MELKTTIKALPSRIKNHVKRHRVKYAVVATATTVMAVNYYNNVKPFYEFLEEKGINPMEYYCPEMLEELTP